MPPSAITSLYREYEEAINDGASSSDVVQILDDWFAREGFPTVLYAGR